MPKDRPQRTADGTGVSGPWTSEEFNLLGAVLEDDVILQDLFNREGTHDVAGFQEVRLPGPGLLDHRGRLRTPRDADEPQVRQQPLRVWYGRLRGALGLRRAQGRGGHLEGIAAQHGLHVLLRRPKPLQRLRHY